MAEEYSHGNQSHGNEAAHGVGVHGEAATETKDRGIFDFLGKKEEEVKPQHRGDLAIHVEVEGQKLEEEKRDDEGGEKMKQGFLEKLHRSNSRSSSSSDEEEAGEGEEKKKRKEKKGLKEKITGEEREEHEETVVPIDQNCGDVVHSSEPSAGTEENNKGFLEKIKEKLPGHDEHKKEDPHPYSIQPEHPVMEAGSHEEETEEKKGIFEKIKEKLPGCHPKSEEDKEKEAY